MHGSLIIPLSGVGLSHAGYRPRDVPVYDLPLLKRNFGS